MSKKNRNNINGWLAINKPEGVNSTTVVSIIKRIFNAQKVGHAGTLDPLACGVLPIALGEATKVINYTMDADKEYIFTIKWGQATSTDDREGEVIATCDKIPSEQEILKALSQFIGNIQQVPPAYSAVKIDGKRAYDIARSGGEVEMKSRQVEIFELELISSDRESSTFRVRCGKGTYVRSLARDIAEKLGTKGHVIYLERSRVGKFCIKNAILLEKFDKKLYKPEFLELLLPVEAVLDDIPVLFLNSEETKSIRHGQKVKLAASDLKNGDIAVLKSENSLIALGGYEGGFIKPLRVFNV